MGVFDYRNFKGESGKTLYSDALELALYAYTPTGQALASGWKPISAGQLCYHGTVGPEGTFFGEQPGFTTANVEVLGRYDAAGKLLSIGITFRGTGGLGLCDTLGDIYNNLQAAFGPSGYADDYSKNAFNQLFSRVAEFARSQGLSGQDVLVSGHSLGGLGVNSLAQLSSDHWGGFYADAQYVAFASPTQSSGGKVLNIGYENDPVFRALDGTSFDWSSLGVHDKSQASATNNIVNFNDHYASGLENLLPQSILNPLSWSAHAADSYAAGLNRVADSAFYDLTSKDSTIIASTLSEANRGKTWVEDLNRNAELHKGSTFIIGTDSNDLLKGGRGNDFIEGRAGNDTFRDGGGYNILLGGQGNNTLDLQQSLKNFSFANDGAGTLYVRDAYGGISMTRDIGAIISKEPGFLWGFWGLFMDDVTHSVTGKGLLAGNQLTPYNHSLNGDAYGNTLVASVNGDWLFGHGGDDVLRSDKSGVTFVGGAGTDVLYSSNGGTNTFLFNGDFGVDTIFGYQSTDKLVFMGVPGVGQGYDYTQHLLQNGENTLLRVGDHAVMLVGVAPASLSAGGIVFA
ncbi:polyurethanase [Pseudomonas sp. SK3(2021)]|uniref:polyurethane esterase n=1 Tax=Pseudomonas sp. SK3(2021) TaxID=2841064 RepID=UPI00192C2A55|nr:polyurethanase [Pseudomonas sp. SK3(2021)]QQZ39608.1 polyurethanase [Pseudomonas sp. SK3(2021)]